MVGYLEHEPVYITALKQNINLLLALKLQIANHP